MKNKGKRIAEGSEISYPEHSIKLRQLKLNHFRGFGNLEINFHDRLTVLISNNGGGKTTVLDAIAEELRYYLHATFLQGSDRTFKSKFKKNDIKNGMNAAKNELLLEVAYTQLEEVETDEGLEVAYTQLEEVETDEGLEWYWFKYTEDANLQCTLNKGEKTTFKPVNVALENPLDFSGYKKRLSEINKEQETLPVLLYYGSGSVETALSSRSSKVSAISKSSRLNNIYNDGLNSHRVNFNQLFLWFDTCCRAKLEVDADGKPWNELAKKAILLQKAVTFMFSDTEGDIYDELRTEISSDGVTVMRLNKKTKDSESPEILDFDQMSSGEKNFLTLVADITMRLIEANPNMQINLEEFRRIENSKESNNREESKIEMEQWLFENAGMGFQKAMEEYAKYKREERIKKEEQWLFDNFSSPLKTGQGIVLIDEIDLHLHPKWQRKIVPKLLELFPNVQFVITTHSPFVVQSVAAESRYMLNNGNIDILDLDTELSYEVIMNEYFLSDKLFDDSVESLLEEFYDFKLKILKGEISKKDDNFIKLLQKFALKSDEVKSMVARDIRYINSQTN